MPLKTNLALILAASSALSGCSTTLGYVKDHPDADSTTNYQSVKEWAYDVSDGYSSRGTINRYSLYWGGALIAGGTGALGGLAATGSTGHASIIIPLSAAFLGTMFGYYQNEQHAQLYFAASDSIKSLILKSEKRKDFYTLPSSPRTPIQTKKTQILAAEKCKLSSEIDTNTQSKQKIHADSQAFTTPSPETITAISKAIDETDSKIHDAQNKLNAIQIRETNIDLLLASNNIEQYEVGCLTNDVNSIMHKVQIHLAQLDPKNVSEDLKKISTSNESKKIPSTPPNGNEQTNQPNNLKPGFDLSDLDPAKVISSCEIEL